MELMLFNARVAESFKGVLRLAESFLNYWSANFDRRSQTFMVSTFLYELPLERGAIL